VIERLPEYLMAIAGCLGAGLVLALAGSLVYWFSPAFDPKRGRSRYRCIYPIARVYVWVSTGTIVFVFAIALVLVCNFLAMIR
jgi:hypothetical protein